MTIGHTVLAQFGSGSSSGQSSCEDSFGTDDTQFRNSSTSESFYINLNRPASCSGTVSSFSYCYYRPDNVTNDHDYTFKFAVYRKQTFLDRYSRVSPVNVVSRKGSNLNAFNCSQYTPVVPITVKAGDVLGICIINSSGNGNEGLTIVSKEISHPTTLFLTASSPDLCANNEIPDGFQLSSLTESSDTVLHLYADIGNKSMIVLYNFMLHHF